jgi:predicted signal transduction protein with EAL and GGDEF domain
VFRSGTEHGKDQLAELRRSASAWRVDDFGTGYSSLEAFAAAPSTRSRSTRASCATVTITRATGAIVQDHHQLRARPGPAADRGGHQTEEQRALCSIVASGMRYVRLLSSVPLPATNSSRFSQGGASTPRFMRAPLVLACRLRLGIPNKCRVSYNFTPPRRAAEASVGRVRDELLEWMPSVPR